MKKDKSRDKQRGINSPNRDVNAANRAALAMGLRAAKLTYDQIAQKVGYANPASARRAIQRELDRTVVEKAEILRTQELAMLDVIHQQVWMILMDPENPRDDETRLAAVDRILDISNQRCKLMGLYKKPEEVEGPRVVVRMAPSGYLGDVTLP